MKPLIFSIFFTIFLTSYSQIERWQNHTNNRKINVVELINDEIWAGTDGGIDIRDTTGKLLRTYTSKDGLASNKISCIHVDHNNDIWVGTKGEGSIAKFNGSNWISYNYQNSELPLYDVYTITSDSNSLWIGTEDRYIISFDKAENWNFYDLPVRYVNDLEFDHDDNLWAATGGGIIKYDGNDISVYSSSFYSSVQNTPIGGLGREYFAISVDKEGDLWFAGRSSVANTKDEGNSWRSVGGSIGIAIGSKTDNVASIYADSSENIWIGTKGGKIYKKNPVFFDWQEIELNFQSYNISSVAVNKQNDFWFSTDQNGLIHYEKDTMKFIEFNESYINNNAVHSLTTDLNNRVIAGTSSGIAFLVDSNWKSLYNTNPTANKDVRVIAADNLGNYWCGSLRGLTKFDGVSLWETYTESNSDLLSDYIYDIKTDDLNNIYIATLRGLNKISSDGTWTTYDQTNSNLIAGDRVYCIEIDSFGNLWLGTRDGLSKFDGNNWTSFVLPDVHCIAFGQNDDIWVGFSTFGEGISHYNGLEWTNYNTSNSGLPHNSVYSLISDYENKIWIGTPMGMSKYDGYDWTDYTPLNSGVSSYFVRDMTIDSQGNIWFASASGLDKYLTPLPAQKKYVRGKVFLDLNQNAVLDSGESYLENEKVQLGPSTGITNEDGEYIFLAESDKDYSLSYVSQNFSRLTQDTTYSFSIDSSDVYLPDLPMFFYDTVIFQTKISANRIRCSSEATIGVNFTNTGRSSDNSNIELTIDSSFIVNNSVPSFDSLVNNVIYYSKDEFLPGNNFRINLDVSTPNFSRIGDTLLLKSSIRSKNIQYKDSLERILFCSYDPNEKEVSPLPIGQEKYTLKNNKLSYTIHFENTGNDTAFYVYIKDTISSSLDLNTFQVIESSHKVNTVIEGRVITFNFFDIDLVDSVRNKKESQGFVSYSIYPKKDLPDYTTVKNTAHIYFDANPAIVTNTTMNNLVTTIPIDIVGIENQSPKNRASIYPQPIVNNSILKFNNRSANNTTLSILDITGKRLFIKETHGNEFELDKNEFPSSGIYSYNIQSKHLSFSGKIIVQ